MIFGFFRSSPEREARTLHKDAVAVLDIARGTYRATVLREIARITREGIMQIEDLAGDDEVRREREIDRFKALHRESRRRLDQTGLTAHTLTIIHARSLALGDAGAPAREAIDAFLREWPPEREPEGTLEG